MTKARLPALDLFRFIACMIVYLGHLVFLPKNFIYTDETRKILSPIMVGDTAVLYFFALSGYVLSINPSKYNAIKWIRRRLLRLYPVYIIAWLLGLFLIILRTPGLLSRKVIGLGFLGFQSVDPNISLVVNPPLWSLSVEILYAFVLYFLIQFRSKTSILFLIPLGYLIWLNFPWSPLARALPFFVIGIFLRSDQVRKIQVPQTLNRVALILIGFWFITIGAYQILQLPNSLTGEISKLTLVSIIIFLASKIEVREKWLKPLNALGERSFCLYAFHYPVLLAFQHVINPSNTPNLVVYLICSAIGSFLLAEFAFRYIDRSSHKIAQSF